MKRHQAAVVISISLAALIGLSSAVLSPTNQEILLALFLGGASICALAASRRRLFFTQPEAPKIWELLLFIALFSGPPRFRSRDPMASLYGVVDWVVVLHVSVWVVGAAWAVYRLSSRRPSKLLLIDKLGIVFATTLALSCFTSPGVLLTGFRAFQVLALVLFSAAWIDSFGVYNGLRTLLLAYMCLGVSIAAAAFFSPDLVYAGERLRGDYIADAGGVGVAGLALLLTTKGLPKTRFFFIAFGLMFLWLVAASGTRTAYVSFLLILLLFVLLGRRSRARLVGGLLISSGILSMLLLPRETLSFLIRDPESVATLSDRTRVWYGLLSYTLHHSPFLGLGFGTERIVTLSINHGVGTAHGSLPAVLAGAGIVGAFAFAVLVAASAYGVFRLFRLSQARPYRLPLASLLLFTLVTGVTSEHMVVPSPAALTFFMVSAISARVGQTALDAIQEPIPTWLYLDRPSARPAVFGRPDNKAARSRRFRQI